MSDVLERDDLIQAAIKRLVDSEASALERYITEWFKAAPDINPADVALRVTHNGSGFDYQLIVLE